MRKLSQWALWIVGAVTVVLLALAIRFSWAIYENVSVSMNVQQSLRLAGMLVIIQFLLGGMVAVLLITAHRKRIQTLKLTDLLQEIETLKRFNENIIANIPSAVLVLDAGFRILSANGAFFETVAADKDHTIGQDLCSVLHSPPFSEENHEKCELRLMLKQVLNEGYPNTHYVVSIDMEHKGKRWLEVSGLLLHGAADRLLVIFEDITQKHKLQQELRERREYVESLFREVPDAIITINSEARVMEWNPGAMRLFGYSRDDAVGQDLDELITGKDKYFESSSLSKIVLSGEQVTPRELIRYRKKGIPVRVILSASPIKSEGRVIGAVGVYSDVTALREAQEALESDNSRLRMAEEALRESEERFRNLAEQSPNMIFIGKGGKTMYVNKMCETILGYTRDEFFAPDFDFLKLMAPASVGKFKRNFEQHLQGEDVPPLEYTLQTKSGRQIEALLMTKLIQYEGESAILGTVSIHADRKLVEDGLPEPVENLRDARLMDAVGQLAGGVEHDSMIR